MSFEPKLYGLDGRLPDASRAALSREETAEAGLPEELGRLAIQLQADARHLAEVYPAGQSERWLPHVHEPAVSWPRYATPRAASAAVVLLAVLAPLWLSQFAPLPDAPSATPLVQQPMAAPIPAVEPVLTPAVSTDVFRSLSGPEQEALLDLMESQRLGQASLSI